MLPTRVFQRLEFLRARHQPRALLQLVQLVEDCLCIAMGSSLSWLVKPASLVMAMLLVVLHKHWSIIDDSESVVSSAVASHPARLSFPMLAGNVDRARNSASAKLRNRR